MRENHEFEVDSIVLHQGIEIHRYHNLLINTLFRTTRINFSSFKHSSLIKNRIKMMTKIPTAGKTRFLFATVLSLILVGSFAFTSEQLNFGVSNNFYGSSISKQPKDTTVYMEVDEPATFMGKDLSEFNIYVAQHVKYPVEAGKSKFQGKVFVQFIVESNGKVEVIKVLRSSGYKILDEEALRVIKVAPSWVPGKKDNKVVRQSFTLPVVFALQ
jgi:periplasmic protein TonB